MSLNSSNSTASGAPLDAAGEQKIASKRIQPHHPGLNPRFCIICCEETEATQQISEEIARWNLPDVRSLLISTDSAQVPINEYRHNLSASQADIVAQAEYAIFITPSEQPCSRIKVNPLDKGCNCRKSSQLSSGSSSGTSSGTYPATLLRALHNCHGQSPQAWWLQLPTTKVRAKFTQPVSCQESVAQALHQIGIFVRNYQRNTILRQLNSQENPAAANLTTDEERADDREMATKKIATKEMATKEIATKETVADKTVIVR